MSDQPASSPPAGGASVSPIAIEDELKRSYLDYAMSVIVSARAARCARRAQARASAHPVIRCTRTATTGTSPIANRPAIVGDVMGKYHPHGDQAIYDALVRMAQDFSMRAPADRRAGQFRLGRRRSARRHALHRSAPRQDRPCADRRSSTRTRSSSRTITTAREREPVVLPARFPNLLVNGVERHRRRHGDQHPAAQSGRSDRRLPGLYRRSLDQPGCADRDRAGAGFPHRRRSSSASRPRAARWRAAAARVLMRARCHVEEIRKDREAIIVTEIPYQVNKARLQERIAELVRDKRRRRHRRHPRRKRPPRHARGDRAEARRLVRRGAQPALSLLRTADELRRQHAGARTAAGRRLMNLKDLIGGVRRVPRRGRHAAHAIRTHQGARPRPYLGRPGGCRGQYRRGDRADPRRPRCRRGARAIDGARLAGEGRGAAGRADRRSAPCDGRRTAPSGCRKNRPRRFWICACSA